MLFDIEKAYDRTWKYHILEMIHRFGICGPLAYFIKNFLENRKFKVQLNNNYSDEREQEQGVPQGSVLSVTLFIIAINNIIEDIPGDVSKSLYVDDLAIYYSSNNIATIERKLQLSINKIHTWTHNNGFKLSTDRGKIVAIHFHRKRGLQTEPDLYLNRIRIAFSETAKFLGMTFDQRLKWKPHIQSLKQSCQKALNIVKCLSNANWGSDRTSLLRIYRSLIRSKLDYGCQIYSSAPEHILKSLNSVHNEALRLCTGAFRSSPVVSLYAESGEPSLTIRRQQMSLQHYIRLARLPGTPAYNAIHNEDTVALFNNITLTAPLGVRMARFFTNNNIPPIDVLPYSTSTEAVWTLPVDIICNHKYYNQNKKDYDPHTLKILFLDHCNEYHNNSTSIYTDGSKMEGGVGCAAFSAEFTSKNKLNNKSSIYTAELSAILLAVKKIYNSANDNFTIYTDSRSTLQPIETINSDHPIVSKIQEWIIKLSARKKKIQFCWVPSHISVAGNEKADQYAREAAVSLELPIINSVPHKDYHCTIKKILREKWQEEWVDTQNNKLRSIKDSVNVWPSSYQDSRTKQVILTRLRIGHTRLTHGHLMEGRLATYCGSCTVPLTVQHLLIECPDYVQERNMCFPGGGGNLNLAGILGEPPSRVYPINKIFKFLNIINIVKHL